MSATRVAVQSSTHQAARYYWGDSTTLQQQQQQQLSCEQLMAPYVAPEHVAAFRTYFVPGTRWDFEYVDLLPVAQDSVVVLAPPLSWLPRPESARATAVRACTSWLAHCLRPFGFCAAYLDLLTAGLHDAAATGGVGGDVVVGALAVAYYNGSMKTVCEVRRADEAVSDML